MNTAEVGLVLQYYHHICKRWRWGRVTVLLAQKDYLHLYLDTPKRQHCRVFLALD